MQSVDTRRPLPLGFTEGHRAAGNRPTRIKPQNIETEKMNTETIQLPHGYTAKIATDDCPMNPYTDWDCGMPIAVFNLDRHRGAIENYKGDELNLATLLDCLPPETWTSRQGKRAILTALSDILTQEEVTERMRRYSEAFEDSIRDLVCESTPYSWGEASDYFDAMEYVAKLAGIPCFNGQSNGYSQGDSALVFVAATPEWRERVGAPLESAAAQCKAGFDLWTAWAWGDVYGVAAIIRPDGEETGESCWGFYGTDHEKSGLMDFCRETVESDIAYLAREAAAAHDAACRDIATAAA
jgi:hypothetical protein